MTNYSTHYSVDFSIRFFYLHYQIQQYHLHECFFKISSQTITHFEYYINFLVVHLLFILPNFHLNFYFCFYLMRFFVTLVFYLTLYQFCSINFPFLKLFCNDAFSLATLIIVFFVLVLIDFLLIAHITTQ